MIAQTSLSTDYDETHWPLAIVVSEAPLDNARLQLGLRTVGKWMKQRQPFALLLISASIPIFQSDRKARQTLDDWVDANLRAQHHSLLGVAVVATDMSDVFLSMRHPRFSPHIPLEVFRNGMDAVAWLRASVLAPAGLTITSL
jgi:hypothetical protein